MLSRMRKKGWIRGEPRKRVKPGIPIAGLFYILLFFKTHVKSHEIATFFFCKK